MGLGPRQTQPPLPRVAETVEEEMAAASTVVAAKAEAETEVVGVREEAEMVEETVEETAAARAASWAEAKTEGFGARPARLA